MNVHQSITQHGTAVPPQALEASAKSFEDSYQSVLDDLTCEQQVLNIEPGMELNPRFYQQLTVVVEAILCQPDDDAVIDYVDQLIHQLDVLSPTNKTIVLNFLKTEFNWSCHPALESLISNHLEKAN